MADSFTVLNTANTLMARASSETKSPAYKVIGISLAVASGVFIGCSFVLKKMGLLKANVKYNQEAGEGYGYLKNVWWWSGMTLMIIGEVCNFVAYAFVDAILVTPLGALSVVITTILSAIFLKERLSFVGKVGCLNCILGSVVIVMNAPEESSAGTIQEMQKFVIAPGFLTYAGIIIVGCVFIAFYLGPRYGKRSMMVYISICSLIGGLSVSATQGLGSAIVAQANGTPQFNQWFLYVLLAFVATTLVTEIIFLNKALNIFNAALVTPTYYVFFTSATIVTSAILFQGFHGTATSITTVCLGFLQICTGVVLLQLSKSAKDVPDAAVFSGDLDQVRTVAEQEQPESEPKADAIRGTAAIIRRISMSRQKMEVEEAKRIQEEKIKDQLDPVDENAQYEWDGIRRRRTISSAGSTSIRRRKTLHPPLGLTHFPDDASDEPRTDQSDGRNSVFENLRTRAQSMLVPNQRRNLGARTPDSRSPMHPVALTSIAVPGREMDSHAPSSAPPYSEVPTTDPAHIYGLPQALRNKGTEGTVEDVQSVDGSEVDNHRKPAIKWAVDEEQRPYSRSTLAPEPPPHGGSGSSGTKRQFSFTNVFHRNRNEDEYSERPTSSRPSSSRPTSSRGVTSSRHIIRPTPLKNATEEEQLGLVKGDSHATNTSYHPYREDDDSWERVSSGQSREISPVEDDEEAEDENYHVYPEEDSQQRWFSESRRVPEPRNIIPRGSRGSRSSDEHSESDDDSRRWEPRSRDGNGTGHGANRGPYL
ncbi:MAG: hypothetical protein M1834_008367 [Cirrosporium novae-zelandiae]|nr:MAG: hypothetical protein M1834_008367 [Cirrosporium novae-zelandiae]